ncbi:ATP-binding cassette domain-containing protein [Janthinobacterium sp.]|uniref:ATP-binding cassette domain-containing protein n=1 Tax=Janthinobacterium sp. TaxID=1871054 RepID=UPI00293D466F|nr:ATP-binding cassette domain-containing protein [Janthinobacterium sp.]
MILAPAQLESDFLSLLTHFEPDDIPPERPPALARQGVPLALRGLTKSYAARSVLKDVGLDLAAGEFVAVVGRSGCGKSTLLRAIAQLERADSGSIVIGSGHMKPDVRIMFQEARLLPWKTVLENVALGLPHSPGAAAAALWTVGLAERADDWPAALSGGQRQRVALARALVHEPQLLLLDEPLGALDALTRIEMQQLIESLWLTRGFTAVLVTHDVAEAVALADRVILIEDGGIALDVRVDLPRPRARGSAAFAALEQRILAHVLRHPAPERAAPLPPLAQLRWAI